MVNEENIQLIRKAIKNREISGAFYPSVYVIEISSLCDLKCIMCPNNQMPTSDKGLIDSVLYTNILEDISPYCEFLMLYWMGEPLMHPEINELLRIARSRIRGKIALSSNMTTMNNEISRTILSNVDILICCLDRWDKQAYERIRLGANFEKSIGNILSLLGHKKQSDQCEIVVKALDIDINPEEYKEFESYWLSKGCRPLLAWLCDWAGTFKQIRQSSSLPIPRNEEIRVPCSDLWFKLVLNWRGDIQMCCFDWKYSHQIGNYDKDNNWLNLTWQSGQILKLREAHSNNEWGANSLCASCKTWAEMTDLNAYVDFNEDSYFTIF